MEPNFETYRPAPAPAKSEPKEKPAASRDPLAVDFADLDKITEESLGFSALTDGLGFHPKKKEIGTLRPSNSMDEAPLGTPGFVEETNAAIAKARGAHIASATTADAPIVDNLAAALEKPSPEAKKAFEPAPIYKLALEEESPRPAAHTSVAGQRPATPQERLTAFAIDIAVIVAPIWLTLLWNFADQPRFLSEHWRSAMLFSAIVFCAYLLIAESLGGQSLGKMALNLVVVEDDKYRKPIGLPSAARRVLFLVAGWIPAGFGSLGAIWDSKSRTWHDKLTASAVERKFED